MIPGYDTLDAATAELVAEYEGWTVTDTVLVVGMQCFDDDGERVGHVIVFPRGGSQPSYITTGLLHTAVNLIKGAGESE